MKNQQTRPKILSLFSGCGGLDLGFHMVGYETVWANDINEWAASTFRRNFGNVITQENIETIKPSIDKTIPPCDLILGGFPCQDFSIIWKQPGLDGDSENILEAIDEAHNNGMGVIALTGKDGGEIKNLVTDQDLFIVNEHETGRIQEMHEFILHTIAELVEDQFPTTAAPNIPGVKSARIKADRIAEMVKSW